MEGTLLYFQFTGAISSFFSPENVRFTGGTAAVNVIPPPSIKKESGSARSSRNFWLVFCVP